MRYKKLALIALSLFLIFLTLLTVVIIVKVKNKRSDSATKQDFAASLTNVRAGNHPLSLNQEGNLRTYIVHIPAGYNKNQTYPLIFSLHGGGSSATEQMNLNDLNQVADKEGFIAIYPNAISNNWNDGRAHTKEKSNNAADVAFMKLIVEKLSQWVSIDAKRVYATGISNGGIMSLRLACEASDTFTAVAPVASSMPEELKTICAPRTPCFSFGNSGNS